MESGFLSVPARQTLRPSENSGTIRIFSGVEHLTYLLDVVVGKCAAILQLLAREDQSLLVRWDAFLVLDLGLDIVDCVARFDFKGDSLTRQGLDKAGEFISG